MRITRLLILRIIRAGLGVKAGTARSAGRELIMQAEEVIMTLVNVLESIGIGLILIVIIGGIAACALSSHISQEEEEK